MAGFVVSLIPLMIMLERNIGGIHCNGLTHKIKLFADDLKAMISDLNEINYIENIISMFESISGIRLHRDPSREKCQALTFGDHRSFGGWAKWPWISKKNTVKIV